MSKEEVIDTKKRVTVIPTDKCKFLETGKPVSVSEKVAERWLKNGKAKPAGKSDEKSGKKDEK